MTENKWECKICIEEAKEAVVTKCGHLFCWACIYEWSQSRNSNIVPCPLCQAEVNITEIIPLYTTAELHQQRVQNLPNRPRPNRVNYQDNNPQMGQMWINGFEINFNLNWGFFQNLILCLVPLIIYVLPMLMDVWKVIRALFFKKQKNAKSKLELLQDYQEYKDLGISFSDFVEYMENDDHIEDIILTVIMFVIIGVIVYRIGKSLVRRIRQRNNQEAQ